MDFQERETQIVENEGFTQNLIESNPTKSQPAEIQMNHNIEDPSESPATTPEFEQAIEQNDDRSFFRDTISIQEPPKESAKEPEFPASSTIAKSEEIIGAPAPEDKAEIEPGIGFDPCSNKNRDKLKNSASARTRFIEAAPEISNAQDRAIFLARIEKYNKCQEWHNMALKIGLKNADKTAKEAGKEHLQSKEIQNNLKWFSRIEFYVKQPKEIQSLILNKIHLISDSNFDLMMKLANIPAALLGFLEKLSLQILGQFGGTIVNRVKLLLRQYQKHLEPSADFEQWHKDFTMEKYFSDCKKRKKNVLQATDFDDIEEKAREIAEESEEDNFKVQHWIEALEENENNYLDDKFIEKICKKRPGRKANNHNKKDKSSDAPASIKTITIDPNPELLADRDRQKKKIEEMEKKLAEQEKIIEFQENQIKNLVSENAQNIKKFTGEIEKMQSQIQEMKKLKAEMEEMKGMKAQMAAMQAGMMAMQAQMGQNQPPSPNPPNRTPSPEANSQVRDLPENDTADSQSQTEENNNQAESKPFTAETVNSSQAAIVENNQLQLVS